MTDEKLFSLKVNHEKLKAVAEAVTAVDEAADEAAEDTVETAVETTDTKLNIFSSWKKYLNFYIFGAIKFNVNTFQTK